MVYDINSGLPNAEANGQDRFPFAALYVSDAAERQRAYYERTAASYDEAHSLEPEHVRAVGLLADAVSSNKWSTALEVGCGTGRVARELLRAVPEVEWSGLDPSEGLLDRLSAPLAAHAVVGDGNALPFPGASFDVVYAFAVLHHVPNPQRVIDEMLRVARRAIFISDSNNFGQGRPMIRSIKRGLRNVGLWKLADFVNTRGKGYHYSEGDGVSYSFSLFSHVSRIQVQAGHVEVFGLRGESDPYRTAPTVALLARK